MEILKKNIRWIILVIILMIIASGVSVYATSTYLASQVNYTKKDGTTITVSDALNDLYNKESVGLYEEILFMIPSQNGSGYDLTGLSYEGNIYYYDIAPEGTNTKGLKCIGWLQAEADSSTYYAKEDGYYMTKSGYGATANVGYYEAGSTIISNVKHRSKGCIIAKLKKEITQIYREP